MSTRLQLRVNKVILGEQALSGAVADVIPISRNENAKAYKGVVIPVGSQDSMDIEVEPGRYLIQAYLPSGNLLSQQVEALPNQTTPVVLQGQRTPHEWLGWQDLVVQRSEEKRAQPSGELPTLLVVKSPASPLTWSHLQNLSAKRAGVSTQDVVMAVQGDPLPLGMTQNFEDDRTVSFVLQTPALPLGSLHYGVVERAGAVDLLSLPIPWHRINRSGSYVADNVDIAIPRNKMESVGVAVQDPQLGPLLGFIASGRLPFANALTKEGTEPRKQMLMALQEKVTNPFAAAVGAYLLLQSDPTPGAMWHSWVQNLANWSPWLPDGAALLGVLRMRFAVTDADVTAAREAFNETWKRGIPVLAPVLRLFLDGVSTLVGDPDAEAGELEAKLPAIRAVARAMATDQAFTSLRLGERK